MATERKNTMTQGSADKIFRHAGKLALIIEKLGQLRHAVDNDSEREALFIADSLAELWSQGFANDCSIFKDFYNRQSF